MIDFVEIGRNVRKYRRCKGLKQCELAELVHVSPQHISHVENSRSQPSLGTLVDIANVLEVGLDQLLGKNIIHARSCALSAQLAQVLDGAPPDLLEHLVQLCGTEVEFYQRKHEIGTVT